MQVQSPNALKWLILSAAIILFDWLTKIWALSSLEYMKSIEVIPGFWNWTLVHNRGAAFSFLAQAGGWQQWLFSALAVIISVACVFMLKKADRQDWRTALPLALIVGGALGNLIDRIRFGYVIDFVHWYYGSFHWPVFNLADSAISIAAVLLIAFSFRIENKAA
ncbi:MAG TPA: signal peptidase II [Arenimonas sp.]|nr:signal peptidase II [Arenimonas sp.]